MSLRCVRVPYTVGSPDKGRHRRGFSLYFQRNRETWNVEIFPTTVDQESLEISTFPNKLSEFFTVSEINSKL